MPKSASKIFEERAIKIQCPINQALAYIAEHGVSTGDNVYYLKRDEGGGDGNAPDGWATQYQGTGKCNGRWIGIKEVIRVAYLYAIKKTPNPRFNDKELNKIELPGRGSTHKVTLTTGKAKKILKDCKFFFEDRRKS